MHKSKRPAHGIISLFLISFLFVQSCTPQTTSDAEPTPPQIESPTTTATATKSTDSAPVEIVSDTPTPTPVVPTASTATPEPPLSRCDGLEGSLEMSILVGPADAAGLPPFAVGQIPFTVSSGGRPYTVQGGGSMTYSDILVKEWGTYDISLNMEMLVEGTCSGEAGAEILQLNVDMNGEQLLVVTSEGFSGEYPWSGSRSVSLSLPVMHGSSQQGEGWTFTLQLTDA